jgi:PAS domain S-box-containing protein
MDQPSDEVKRLQGCVSDLISVLALPAIWTGRAAPQIVSTLLDALLRLLRLDFAYLRLDHAIDGSPIEAIRAAQPLAPPTRIEAVGEALGRVLTESLAPSPRRIPNPIGDGEVSIASFRLGIGGEGGILVAGSRRSDFPTQTEALVLQVAANQAAIGFREARLLAERKRNEERLERRVVERTSQLEAVKNELAAELGAMTGLHELSTRLLASMELQPLLDEVLRATIALQNADFGNVQLYNPETQALEIVAQRGFGQEFLDYFSGVHEDSAACGRALQTAERVIIEDVETDPDFAPHRQIAVATGFRAVQSTPLFSRSGEPLGMISTHFRRPHRPSERELGLTDLYARQAAEMIERRQAEAALRRSEEQFRLLAEAIPHQVWACLPDASLTYCSRQWNEYSGLTLQDVQREGWDKLLHPEDVGPALRAWEDARSQRKPYDMEVRLRASDGSYRRFVSRAVPVYGERGQVIQWFGTNTDVEDGRQLQEALHKVEAEVARVARLTVLGELAATLAHELNQPLAAVVTNGDACLRWLGRDQPNLDEASGAVRRMVRDAKRAADVIAHTRALLRKSNGEKVGLDVAKVIRQTLLLVQSEAARHRIVMREILADDLPMVLGDRVQLQQVILNLILNGIEAMADVEDRSPELVIMAERNELDDRPGVLVAVQDAGVGVAPENLDRLFEALYTTKPDGLGMGLSISRSLVHAHGGRLWATRNAGHGSTFHFVLPAWLTPAS